MNASHGEKSVREILKEGLARLRSAEVPSFTLAAELLLLHAIGRDRTWLYAHPEELIADEDARRYCRLVARRAAGEPTQYLTGRQEFWGLEFEVTPDVLIPRPETEHVIEIALDRLALRGIRAGRKQTLTGEGMQIADVGTGSGCIAISLAKELPGARIWAMDISPKALAVARRNAEKHQVAERVRFVETNLLENIEASDTGAHHATTLGGSEAARGLQLPRHGPLLFDLIAGNPPYIGRKEKETLMREVRDHEPEVALYGGEEGYEFYADLIAQAAQNLKAGGLLVLELGHNSLPTVQPLLEAPAWINTGVTNDLAGIPRVVATEKT